MNKLIKVAVDAMGGDNAPQKIIDGIELHHKKSKNTFYRLFGNKNIIEPAINKKSIDKKINSIHINTAIPFLLVITPKIPIVNKAAAMYK